MLISRYQIHLNFDLVVIRWFQKYYGQSIFDCQNDTDKKVHCVYQIQQVHCRWQAFASLLQRPGRARQGLVHSVN